MSPRRSVNPPRLTSDELLISITRKTRQASQLEAQISDLISSARASGASWDEIAAAAGRNRETLRRRFGESRAEP